jgi:polar amino acid transport system substrate-binding protein
MPDVVWDAYEEENMRKARTWLVQFVVLAMAFSLFAVAGCGGGGNAPEAEKPANEGTETAGKDYKLVTPGKLTIGSDLDFPPMEQLNGSTPEGFDVELMQAIAKEMGLEAEYLPPQKFDTLLASVNAGKFDVVASSLTISDERKKEVAFSDPYFDSNQSIASSLSGAKVCVTRPTSQPKTRWFSPRCHQSPISTSD